MTGDWKDLSALLTDTIGPHREMKDYFDHICSEVLEAFDCYASADFYEPDDGKPEGFEIELADIIILTLALAELTESDLNEALDTKIKWLLKVNS